MGKKYEMKQIRASYTIGFVFGLAAGIIATATFIAFVL